jgi:hypothetical protein
VQLWIIYVYELERYLTTLCQLQRLYSRIKGWVSKAKVLEKAVVGYLEYYQGINYEPDENYEKPQLGYPVTRIWYL